MTETFRRNLFEALVICALGSVLGLSFNYRLLMDIFEGRAVQTAVEPAGGPAVPVAFSQVDVEGVRQKLAVGALAVDARIVEMYAEGRLPGARSLPLDEIDTSIEAFLREVPRGRELVVYCSGYGCPDSGTLAARLVAEGYGRVSVYEGGFPEWQSRGLPVESGP